jgi:hypothetical protein
VSELCSAPTQLQRSVQDRSVTQELLHNSSASNESDAARPLPDIDATSETMLGHTANDPSFASFITNTRPEASRDNASVPLPRAVTPPQHIALPPQYEEEVLLGYGGLRLNDDNNENDDDSIPSDEEEARHPVPDAQALSHLRYDTARIPTNGDLAPSRARIQSPELQPRRRVSVPNPELASEDILRRCMHGKSVKLPKKKQSRGRRILRPGDGMPTVIVSMRGDTFFLDDASRHVVCCLSVYAGADFYACLSADRSFLSYRFPAVMTRTLVMSRMCAASETRL